MRIFVVGQLLLVQALLLEGSWDLAKYSVKKVGPSQPARRERGSKIVKTKQGIGGRIEVIMKGEREKT